MQTQMKLVLAAIMASSLSMANAEDEHHPADAPASTTTASAPSESAMNNAMSEQMQKMQAAHDKAAAAKTPDERQAALQEGMKTMKESMAMMSKQHDAAGCMGMGSNMGMSGSKDGMGKGMMGMMMKMMDQQSSMIDMPVKK
ncbi:MULTISPECIES: hypothetical protein [Pseudomonas]|jgi:hypothetical protein|uniref:hypothetical protein n=1 Tax=Pseudomonas TaxID=286 RepID=UPI00062AF15B|nr:MULTISPECIES: hypothetical protein [Pseudomonas]KKX58768.1 hypothetical protein PU99_22645 [Pseudomonas putida]MCK8655924.1 hypothetical protein [Pseudomonas umsongensis]NBB62243.1 hypothetical protein [Pseudomonas sp. ODNR1LW]OMQ39312.1 hypothetical protein BKX96_08890 [Pseudomonas putida]